MQEALSRDLYNNLIKGFGSFLADPDPEELPMAAEVARHAIVFALFHWSVPFTILVFAASDNVAFSRWMTDDCSPLDIRPD